MFGLTTPAADHRGSKAASTSSPAQMGWVWTPATCLRERGKVAFGCVLFVEGTLLVGV